MTDDSESDIDYWVEKIGTTELPILNQTNSYITSTETYLKSHASDIAKAIMHDPNMTAKILRLANSVFFNTCNMKINTVSKAVVFLGYDAIRSICFTTAIFEKLVAGQASKRVLSTIANSIHAAVQAKMFADQRKLKHTEEVFIAALLYNIGELSFWCIDSPEADSIEQAMRRGSDFKHAQKAVLGFEFNELTKAVTKDWQISEVLTEALEGEAEFDSKANALILGFEAVHHIESGWGDAEGKRVMGKLEDYTGLEREKLVEKMKENSSQAAQVIREFGVKDALEFIPGTQENKKKKKAEEKRKQKVRADPKVQIDFLGKLTKMSGASVDVNKVLKLTLEGIEKGTGMDRAVAAIINPKLKVLKSKFVFEKEGTGIRDKFSFPIVDRGTNVYDLVLHKLQTIWVSKRQPPLYNQEESQTIMRRLNVDEFLIGPMIVHGKAIGVIYADRVSGDFEINDEDFESFSLFIKQAGNSLASFGD